MRSKKGSRRIVVADVECRWRAAGNDGYISVGIWPTNNIGPYIQGNFLYHATRIDNSDGSWTSARDQIVVTSRIIRRIIEHALNDHAYNPNVPGNELNLRNLDDVIDLTEVVRASK